MKACTHPGKEASPCNREVKFNSLGRTDPTKRAGPPPCKKPLRDFVFLQHGRQNICFLTFKMDIVFL